MIEVYGIKNCDTCRKALKWLAENNLEHRFHDFRKVGLDPADVGRWAVFLSHSRSRHGISRSAAGRPHMAPKQTVRFLPGSPPLGSLDPVEFLQISFHHPKAEAMYEAEFIDTRH